MNSDCTTMAACAAACSPCADMLSASPEIFRSKRSVDAGSFAIASTFAAKSPWNPSRYTIFHEVVFQLSGAVAIRLKNNFVKNRVARRIPGRIAGTSPGISARLSPAIFRQGEAVMAGVALQLGIFWPVLCVRARFQAQQGLPQLHGLAGGQLAHVVPWIAIFRLARLARFFPVARHDGGKGIELEIKVRVAGSDHFVVNRFFLAAQMAAEAFFAALSEVAGVVHAHRDGFFMRPVALGVWAEPSGGRAMATFAAHAFA